MHKLLNKQGGSGNGNTTRNAAIGVAAVLTAATATTIYISKHHHNHHHNRSILTAAAADTDTDSEDDVTAAITDTSTTTTTHEGRKLDDLTTTSTTSTCASTTQDDGEDIEEEEEEEEGRSSLTSNRSHATHTQLKKQQPPQREGERLPSHILRERVKEKRKLFQNALLSMKSPMYDNIHMLAPNGELLCKISLRKARWYVAKDLADWTTSEGVVSTEKDYDDDEDGSDDGGGGETKVRSPRYITLRFEPKGRSNNDPTSSAADGAGTTTVREFDHHTYSYLTKPSTPTSTSNTTTYDDNHDITTKILSTATYTKADKRNICVSCSSNKHLVRHSIIPYTYRTLFPTNYKSRMSHDIVLLCCRCNEHCEQEKQKRMKRVERSYQPVGGYEVQLLKDRGVYRVRSSALALKNWRGRMPVGKVVEHERVVRDFLVERRMVSGDDGGGGGEVTEEQLDAVLKVDYQIENPNYVSRSEIVVSSIVHSEEEMTNFIRGWRAHFVEVCHPRFMPEGWSVDNPVMCKI